MKKRLTGLLCVAAVLLMTACANQSTRPAPKVTLENTNWVLSSVADKIYNPPAGVRLIMIKLDGNQRVSGYLGCNNLAGSYALSAPDGIRFNAASTRMACLGDGMAYENRLQRALTNANRYQIDKGKLMLYQDQTPLAVFVARQ